MGGVGLFKPFSDGALLVFCRCFAAFRRLLAAPRQAGAMEKTWGGDRLVVLVAFLGLVRN